ncbi:MAG: phosphoribosylanthranilate isomerase [Clostridiales bacterium]|nr:phosphoribosylanthranilate isomerase [Clostridiales bacterium]
MDTDTQHNKVKIKICGIKNAKEVDIINKFLPDFTGFVFAPGKRTVTSIRAGILSQMMDKSIKKAGVFVNATIEEIIEIIDVCPLDIIQLHGEENRQYINLLKIRLNAMSKLPLPEVWKSIKAINRETILQTMSQGVDRYLLDTCIKGRTGGTGIAFDWKMAADIKAANQLIIVAGGLTPENVAEAVKITDPYAVDVSSGVENDGLKDQDKVESFITNVRNVTL